MYSKSGKIINEESIASINDNDNTISFFANINNLRRDENRTTLLL